MVTSERLAEEAERMRRVPGIYFADSYDGRRAKVGRLDVWEIINAWQAWGRNFDELCREMDWVAPEEHRAAVDYYARYPDEIDRFIAENDAAFALIEKFAPLSSPYPAEFRNGVAGSRDPEDR